MDLGLLARTHDQSLECLFGVSMRVEVGTILRSNDGRLYLVLEVKWSKKSWHRSLRVKSLDHGAMVHLPYSAIKHMEVICK